MTADQGQSLSLSLTLTVAVCLCVCGFARVVGVGIEMFVSRFSRKLHRLRFHSLHTDIWSGGVLSEADAQN